MQVIANEVFSLTEAARNQKNGNGNGKANGNGTGEKVHVYIREAEISADELVRLRDTLLDYPGQATVFLHMLKSPSGETVIELPEQVRIASSAELEQTVEKLFGQRVAFHALNS